MSANGTLPLAGVRDAAARALTPATDTDPAVLPDLVDSVEPPAVMLIWDDPWLTPSTIGHGFWDAHLTFLCLSGRVEPGPGIEALETLVDYVVDRLTADGYSWPVERSQAPRVFTIGNIPLLGARLTCRVPVAIGGQT